MAKPIIPNIQTIRPAAMSLSGALPPEEQLPQFEVCHDTDDEVIYFGPNFDAGRYHCRLGIVMQTLEDGPYEHWQVVSSAEESEGEVLEEFFVSRTDAEKWAEGKEEVEVDLIEEPFIYGELRAIPRRVNQDTLAQLTGYVGKEPEELTADVDMLCSAALEYGTYLMISAYQGIGKLHTDDIMHKLMLDGYVLLRFCGFFFDAPVNLLGETGWAKLDEWGASIGSDDKTKAQAELPEDAEPGVCTCCGEERELRAYNMAKFIPEVYTLCEDCLDGYIVCDGCSGLVAAEEGCWAGTDWYETLDGERLCADCFTVQFAGGRITPSQVVNGGQAVTTEITKSAKRIPTTRVGDKWESVYSEDVSGMFPEWTHPMTALRDMNKIVSDAPAEHEFVIGLQSSQFFYTVTMFRRTA